MADTNVARVSNKPAPTSTATAISDKDGSPDDPNASHGTSRNNSDNGNSGDGAHNFRRDISTRQMILFALGGSIGAGLFVASGQALHTGGPGSLVLNFLICGSMVSLTMASLGEMSTSYPVAGAFYDYTVRFVGRQAGFTMGWNFAFNWLFVLPFELVTIVALVKYWVPDVQPAYIITPFLAFLGLAAFKGARWFGEVEHWLGVCKALCISVFIFFALAAAAGGIPGDERGALRGRFWHAPEGAAFRNGFHGFLSVFRAAGMAFGGTELLGLTVAECRRPQRIMPMATKVVFFRLAVFYVVALLMLGFVVSANDPGLAEVGQGAKTSPFVLAANNAGLPGLGHFFNAMIITALVSMANSSSFSSSRALQALCAKGMGPRFLSRVSAKHGAPMQALAVAFVLAALAYVACAPGGEELFDWLLSLSSMSNYFTWLSINASHVRMRRAMASRGIDPRRALAWRSPFGIWGSYVGMAVAAVGLVANCIIGAWPVGGGADAKSVVRDYLGVASLLLVFCGYSAWCYVTRTGEGPDGRSLLVPIESIDLVTGYREKGEGEVENQV